MNEHLARQLAFHRSDYERVAGKPFRCFYCPILFRDEEVELQRGHIVNEAFKGSPGAWVVQRRDVDSFFGTHFEADFEVLQYADKLTFYKTFSDKKLYSHYRPKLLFRNTPISYFPYRGGPLPKGYYRMEIPFDSPTDPTFWVAIKIEDLESMVLTEGEDWTFETSKDLRLPALVSLIKAAHLSLFSLLGYNYAFTYGGYFVGHDILGRFYVENRGKDKRQILQNALSFFKEFQHMVRPIQFSPTDLGGTITDGVVRLCGDSAGPPWGLVVFVRTGREYACRPFSNLRR